MKSTANLNPSNNDNVLFLPTKKIRYRTNQTTAVQNAHEKVRQEWLTQRVCKNLTEIKKTEKVTKFNEMKQPIPMQTTLLNAEIPTDSIPPLTMLANCSTLAKVLNVSRTSVKRFVDSGVIELNADGLADVKQATHAVLTKSTHVKKRLLKSEIDEATVLRKQITELTTKLLDTRAKLKETQTDLERITNLYDQNSDDYFALDEAISAFIDALVNDDDLKMAVFEGNRHFIKDAFDNLHTHIIKENENEQ